MYKIKLHLTSKCLWPEYVDMFVVKWMNFFGVFINHFRKIHGSVLHNRSIVFLKWLWRQSMRKKFGRSTAYSCRTAEQMSLYHLNILREKRDSNTGVFLWNFWNFQEQWWLLHCYTGVNISTISSFCMELIHAY